MGKKWKNNKKNRGSNNNNKNGGGGGGGRKQPPSGGGIGQLVVTPSAAGEGGKTAWTSTSPMVFTEVPVKRQEFVQGEEAFGRGEIRLAADLYLLAFQRNEQAIADIVVAGRRRTGGVAGPNNDANHLILFRTHYFSCYCRLLYMHMPFSETVPNVSKEEFKFLKGVADSGTEEHAFMRADASNLLGYLYKSRKHDYDLAAEFFRQTVSICDSARAKEKGDTFMEVNEMMIGKDILDTTREVACNYLRVMTTCPDDAKPPSSTTASSSTTTTMANDDPGVVVNYEPLKARLCAGGEICDCCGKSRTELGIPSMNTCGRCGMAYYCSTECQATQWKAGHKVACRRLGEIKVGDIMVVRGIAQSTTFTGSMPNSQEPHHQVDLNGSLVVIVQIFNENHTLCEGQPAAGAGAGAGGSVAVQRVDDRDNVIMIITPQHLFRIRPAV